MNAYSAEVLAYFAERAIDPKVAAEVVGVAERSGEVVFTYRTPDGESFERARSLNGAGPAKVKQPKGRPLTPWRPTPGRSGAPIVLEGESDALAALSALARSPEPAGLRELPVIAAPGTGCPPERVVEAVRSCGSREAFLCLDADEAGRRYTGKLAEALRAAGIRPVVLELPDDLDLAAWLAGIPEAERGERFASALVDAEAAAPALDERAEWAERRPLDLDPGAGPEPPDYLVAGRIERGTVTVLAGDTGAAKSWAAQALAVAIVEGADEWLGYRLNLRHRRAVVVDEENPERLVRARLRALGLSPEGAHRLRYFHRIGARLGEGDWCEWLGHDLQREPADLLAIDTGTAATTPELTDNREVADFYRAHLRPLAADAGVAILLLLHERKPPTQGPRGPRTMATLGARSWIGQADAQLMLSRRGEASEERTADDGYRLETRFTLEVGKLRDGGAERSEVVRVGSTLDSRRALLTAEVVSEGEAEPKQTAEEAVQELLEATPGLTRDQLVTELDFAERTVRRALDQLGAEDDGGRPKRWHLPESVP